MPNRILAALAAALLVPCAASATPPATEREIDALLDGLDGSRCAFWRNGDWYDASRARTHIERKYAWLAKRDRIATTEDFIVLAASRSSRSGEPYRVRCGAATVEAESWLRAELAKMRAGK